MNGKKSPKLFTMKKNIKRSFGGTNWQRNKMNKGYGGKNERNQNRIEMQWNETKMENGKFYDSLLNLGNVIGSLVEEPL